MNRYRLNEDTEVLERRAARECLKEVECEQYRQLWVVYEVKGRGYLGAWWDSLSPYGWLCSRGYVESVDKARSFAQAELWGVEERKSGRSPEF